MKIVSLASVCNEQIKLQSGELLSQIIIDSSYLDLPYVCLKRTKISKVGYPVVSIAVIVKDKQIRIAFIGVCDYPFRSLQIESILNDGSLSIIDRIEKVVLHLPSEIVDDIQGSQAYRTFVLKNLLQETMKELEMGE